MYCAHCYSYLQNPECMSKSGHILGTPRVVLTPQIKCFNYPLFHKIILYLYVLQQLYLTVYFFFLACLRWSGNVQSVVNSYSTDCQCSSCLGLTITTPVLVCFLPCCTDLLQSCELGNCRCTVRVFVPNHFPLKYTVMSLLLVYLLMYFFGAESIVFEFWVGQTDAWSKAHCVGSLS